MLIFSLYVTRTLSPLFEIIEEQPNPSFFYKTFLELDGTNVVSMLSFSNKCLEFLLDEQYQDLFQSKYPIFYKNKISKGKNGKDKYFYRSAIDTALRNDQLQAVQEIISYITKFQNNFISSFLFGRNLL